jgi:hypothetical protein
MNYNRCYFSRNFSNEKTNNFKKNFEKKTTYFYYNAPQGLRQTFSDRGNLAGKPAIILMAGADWKRRFAFLFHKNYNLKNEKIKIFLKKIGGKIWK